MSFELNLRLDSFWRNRIRSLASPLHHLIHLGSGGDPLVRGPMIIVRLASIGVGLCRDLSGEGKWRLQVKSGADKRVDVDLVISI